MVGGLPGGAPSPVIPHRNFPFTPLDPGGGWWGGGGNQGAAMLRRIKADARLRSVPVVVLTSSREERDLVESYNLGANSYIVKPVDFAQFTESVRQLGLYWMLLNEAPQI